MAERGKGIRIRIRLVGVGFILAFGLVAARSYQLQVLNHETWDKRAERQHQKVLELTPQRGTIYDRNGEELALSIEVDSIFLEPAKVTDPQLVARELGAALDLPTAAIRGKLGSERGFVWVKRQVSAAEGRRVRELDLAGVGAIREHRRFYPNSEVGAQVIGFTGLDPRGLEGLELAYDGVILGEGGYLVTERDALGRGLGGGDFQVRGSSRGADLYLTLDRNLQFVVEKELALGVEKARATAGTVVILEPDTGRVLAMASQPGFNPNAFSQHRPEQWRNRAICDTFEPGSTFKPFLVAAALEEGLVDPGKVFDCENGAYAVGGKVVHDHHAYDELPVHQILKFSSNIGSAKIAELLNRQRFHSYLKDFGFGSVSGIDLPGEVTGLLRGPEQWFDIDLAAMAFGQGVSVTALQLTAATAAIANGGRLMAPYVVEKIVEDGGVVEKRTPRLLRRVLSEKTAATLREMLVATTEEGGTGTLGAVPGFRVAGKTGTAQKVDPVTGGYSLDKRVASFVGFLPAEDPRLVMLVVIDEPKGTTYGGLVAAPVFARIADKAMRYLEVPPDQPPEPSPSPPVQLAAPALPAVPAAAASSQAIASGMPDFLGMSYRQVLRTMEEAGLNVKLEGSGRVVRQSPAAGEPIRYGQEVRVRLAPPS